MCEGRVGEEEGGGFVVLLLVLVVVDYLGGENRVLGRLEGII